MYKLIVLAAALACVNAGLLAPAAITSQSSNIVRSWGNLGQVSTYSKTIDTPYSSVSKSDIRVSNPGIASIGSPILAQRIASPLITSQGIASPLLAPSPILAQRAIAAPAIASPLLAPSPILAQRAIAPAIASPVISHVSYASPVIQYGW